MLDPFGPAQVRNVHQPVDAVFDLNESAEISQVAYASFNDGSDGILLLELFPWILLKLLHSKRDAAVIRVDAQDDGVNLIAGLDHLRWMLHPFGPGHLRDVDK